MKMLEKFTEASVSKPIIRLMSDSLSLRKVLLTVKLMIALLFGFFSQTTAQTPGYDCNQVTHLTQLISDPTFYSVTYLYIEYRNGIYYGKVYEVECLGLHKKRRCKGRGGVCGKGKLWTDDYDNIIEVLMAFPDDNEIFDPENQIHNAMFECFDQEGNIYSSYTINFD